MSMAHLNTVDGVASEHGMTVVMDPSYMNLDILIAGQDARVCSMCKVEGHSNVIRVHSRGILNYSYRTVCDDCYQSIVAKLLQYYQPIITRRAYNPKIIFGQCNVRSRTSRPCYLCESTIYGSRYLCMTNLDQVVVVCTCCLAYGWAMQLKISCLLMREFPLYPELHYLCFQLLARSIVD